MDRRMVLATKLTFLFAALWSGAAFASPPHEVSNDSDVPLYENLGSLHHPITTGHPKAQQYFDQGLRLVYAFNHEEAINSFEQALLFDDQAAMAWWGIALALGPNINALMGAAEERRAFEAVARAKRLSDGSSPSERAYIEALAVRYASQPETGREERDRAYALAMEKVWRQWPDDVDAGTLFAEALMVLQPWDFWARTDNPRDAPRRSSRSWNGCSPLSQTIRGPAITIFIRWKPRPIPSERCPVRIGCRIWCRARGIWFICRGTSTSGWAGTGRRRSATSMRLPWIMTSWNTAGCTASTRWGITLTTCIFCGPR